MKPRSSFCSRFWKRGPALVVVFLCLGPGSVSAGWSRFLEGDGLAGTYVHAIHEDSSEAIWFGTAEGVSRFDGVTWTTYTTADGLSKNAVLAIEEDSSGALWFGTALGGVSRFDGATWTTFTTADGLVNDLVLAIHEDSSGTLWFGTDGGVSRFDGVTWTSFTTADGLADNSVQAIGEDSSGALWFGTYGGGVSRFDGMTWTTFTTNDGLADNGVWAIEEDSSGALWFGTYGGGVSRFDGVTWTTFTTNDGLAGNVVLAIHEDSSGALWFGAAGVSRFDGTTWTTFSTADGLVSNDVHAIEEDSSSALWFGTFGGGVSRFDAVTWTTFTTNEGLVDNRVRTILDDSSGALWFGTNAGVSRFDGVTWTTFTTANGLADDDVWAIEEDSSGALWFGFGLGGGVSRFDGVTWTTFTTNDGLANNWVKAIHEDSSGALWFGTNAGVSRFDGSTWTTFTTADGLAANSVLTIEEDSSGAHWFGFFNGRVTRFDGVTWTTFTTADGLAANSVLAIEEDSSGALWFGTFGGGVSRYDGMTWTTFTTDDGLAGNAVRAIEVDSSDALWFGTEGGVSCFDGVTWTTFTINEGLADNDLQAILEDSSGALWFGTSYRGVTQHRPDRVRPQTVVTIRPPSVSANSGPSVGFEAAFKEVERILFSYAPDGAPWSEWSATNSWTGRLLPDGVHTFEVRSRDRVGNVDPTPALVRFEIDATPPAPVIASPAFGQPVSGTVSIVGTAADPRFKEYRLESRPLGTESWTSLAQSASPVANGVLGVWDTESVPDGVHEIRLSVSDTLGLTGPALVRVEVDNEFPPAAQTSPARISARAGGDVFTTNREVHLYFPPGSFRDDAVVKIEPADTTMVPATFESGAQRVLSGAGLSWGEFQLLKPAVLDLSLEGVATNTALEKLAIYVSTDGATWEHVGGTLDREAGMISTAITAEGQYAVFSETGVVSRLKPLGLLGVVPRVFSPTGGFSTPNVSISFSLGSPASATIRVYSRSGRLVREVASGRAFNAGANVVQWDGRDAAGNIVVDGLYLVSVQALGETRVKTLAVVR